MAMHDSHAVAVAGGNVAARPPQEMPHAVAHDAARHASNAGVATSLPRPWVTPHWALHVASPLQPPMHPSSALHDGSPAHVVDCALHWTATHASQAPSP